MFHVWTIDAASGRVETSSYDLVPALPQGQMVCNLFAEFLAGRPPEFRERLTFLKKGDIELQWAGASGGSAFTSFFSGGRTLGMAILPSGIDPDSDGAMIDALREMILIPMFSSMFGEDVPETSAPPERPLVVLVQFDEQPELIPTLHLLITALASVYFRAIQQMAGGVG
jgi:hypothetical protein